MYHWGIKISSIYFILLALLAGPLIYISFYPEVRINEMVQLYSLYGIWLFVFVLAISQFALLSIPVRKAFNRPIAKRHIIFTIIVTSLFFAILLGTTSLAIYEAIAKLKFEEYILWFILGITAFSWLLWSIIFIRHSQNTDPVSITDKIFSLLIKGSILELLIVVPSHIYVRNQTYCCAGIFTFVGLASGISIMLLAFGPSTFILYKSYIDKKKNPVQQ